MRLSPTGVIIGEEHAEPIVPMGLLASSLKCSITWTGNGVEIIHPKLGPLDVKLQDGCPTVPHDVALTLIKEIEDLASVAIKSIQLNNHTELQWMKRLVDEHPVFAPLPEDIKNALVEIPADDLVPLANRRTRKAWKKHGVLVHAYSGEAEGYTLRRAFHEVGGDRRLLHELDLQHGKPETDMSPSGKAYPLLAAQACIEWNVQGLDCWTSVPNTVSFEAFCHPWTRHAEAFESLAW